MGSMSGSDIFGGITFVLVVALALAAIAVMIYGRHLKQQRLAAERELIERREAAHVDTVAVAPEASIEADEPAGAAEAEPAAETSPEVETTADAAPAPNATPATSPGSTDGDITQLKGLGPKLAATLAELGYTRLDQIAALTPDQAAELDSRLGNFQGRMTRDRWIEQARLLVAGDRAAYEAAFGKLG